MKNRKILVFIVISIFISGVILSGCGESVSKDQEFKQLLKNVGWDNADIVIIKKTFVPDSLRPAMAEWITETVRAASYRLTTCDYEDPEDVIKQTVESANEVFTRTYNFEGLRKYVDFDGFKDIAYDDLTNDQKKVFDFLKIK